MWRTVFSLGVWLALLIGAGASGLPGMDRPARLGTLKALLPDFSPGHLPGHATGVLQQDPAAPGRIVLWAGGHVWSNLFVPDPQTSKSIRFPVDGRGGALSLPTGVRIMAPSDVRLPLPAVVDVTVNLGRGVSSKGGFLCAVKPDRWKLPLVPIVGACLDNWKALADRYDPAPHRDLSYLAWDDARHLIGVVCLRKPPNRRFMPNPRRWGPVVLSLPPPQVAARYWIDSHGRVVEKWVAGPSPGGREP